LDKKVLFYAINGLGLGHLTRLIAIARQMEKQDSTIKPIFLTSSEACQVLYKHNIPYFKMPSKNLASEANMKISDLSMMYQLMMSNLINTFRPRALVVDTFPLGSLNDLFGILGGKLRVKKIYVHREQRPEKMTQARIAVQNFYDLVITPHKKGSAKIPVPDEEKLFWAGNILVREKDELLSKAEVLDTLNLPKDKKIVYLTLGGGGDPTDDANINDVIDIISQREDMHIVIAKAPLCRKTFKSRENITVIDWYPVIELMNAFDIAISGAGYNTFHELLFCGVPSIFIPKLRMYDDQEKRALEAERHNACFCLKEENIRFDLSHMIDELLLNREFFSENAQKLVPRNGAELAAEKILELI